MVFCAFHDLHVPYLYSYRGETARQLRMYAQLMRCFSAVAELLVLNFMLCYVMLAQGRRCFLVGNLTEGLAESSGTGGRRFSWRECTGYQLA